jgi:putative peptide zinc metalloprotease protein
MDTMSESFHSPFWYRLSALRPRLKPHVETALHDYLGRPWYVLRDPVTGKVHRFSEAAYAVIGGMDGHHSLDQIWTAAAARLDHDAPSQTDVVQLLSQLYQADLLSVDGVPDAAELLERMQRHRAGKRQRFYKNPMFVPLPLFNPDPLLEALAFLVKGRLAGPVWALVWLAAIIPALVLLPA